MNFRTTGAVTALALAMALTACSGGSGGSTPPTLGGGGGSTNSTAQSETAIMAANALGNPIKSLTQFNADTISAGAAAQTQSATPNGTCNAGVKFWSPDKAGQPNSTQQDFFYNANCTGGIARDVLRIFVPNGSSETLTTTATMYALGAAGSSAVRTDASVISHATFNANGYAIAADGFDRESSGSLNIAGSRTINSDYELIMQPASGDVNSFCSDSAGYNATGIPSLDETFGWQGGVNNGTRINNGSGSITWSATHAGTSFKGPIGGLSIAPGTFNTACPITTPAYSLTGGTAGGSYSLPVTATYTHGILTALSVANGMLANGNTLNAASSSSLPPGNPQFITGAVTNGGTTIASFAVDAFGDGTLTVTKNGSVFAITDWHVVK
jgi:hypothetical protein